MDLNQGKLQVRDYYDQEARDYIKQYRDGQDQYPANLIRIKLIIQRLKKNGIKTIMDAGCGTCGPMIKLLKEGYDVKGFDFSNEMVKQGKKELEKAGYDQGLVYTADLEEGKNFSREKFDAALALGVFPHILNGKKALSNMGKMLNSQGLVFIEFRNDLFAAFTLNKYSLDFFLNRIIDLKSFPPEIAGKIIDFYTERFKVEMPKIDKSGKIRYEDIIAYFHNPLTLGKALFEPCRFSIVDIHFYHYHALPPIFENQYPLLFRGLSFSMERPNDWRGYFMASAFVVEARKKD